MSLARRWSAMSTLRRAFIIAFLISVASLFMFIAVWYAIAANFPPQLQGIVMISAAFLIVFGFAAKAFRGGRSLQEYVGISADKTKTSRLTNIIILLVLVAMWTLPALILYLVGYR